MVQLDIKPLAFMATVVNVNYLNCSPIQLWGLVTPQIPEDYQLYHFKTGAGRCQGGNAAGMRLQSVMKMI